MTLAEADATETELTTENTTITPSVFLDGRVELYGGDSREVLRGLPDAYFDSIVCDPPYALVSIVKRFGGENAAPAKDGDVYSRASSGFMGKQWDTGETAFATEFWAQIYRVLKPGGHVVAFSGTRSYHRLAVAIEDSGFEIRDQLAWVYGSGFPKSHDVSKGIDKAAGVERKVVGKKQAGIGSGKTFGMLQAEGDNISAPKEVDVTAPATPAAHQWQGWGTALKPSWEPIVLARKPISEKTVAANVLKWGTGALNVDGCRVGTEGGTTRGDTSMNTPTDTGWNTGHDISKIDKGRWPANIVHDGSDEVLAGFPETKSGTGAVRKSMPGMFGLGGDGKPNVEYGDAGSAARFFYSAKADKLDRIGSKHPTVKPVDLMQWLCRLVTPPGGRILDPFAGSGSTGEAAWREGFDCTLIEREPEYQADIAERLNHANKGPMERKARAIKQTVDMGPLFGGANDNVSGGADRYTATSPIRTSVTGGVNTMDTQANSLSETIDRGIMAGKGGFGFRISGKG